MIAYVVISSTSIMVHNYNFFLLSGKIKTKSLSNLMIVMKSVFTILCKDLIIELLHRATVPNT